MVDPVAFADRMVGLNAVPEPLWWLLGAIVAFYFGARETYYFRNRTVMLALWRAGRSVPEDNAALDEWRARTERGLPRLTCAAGSGNASLAAQDLIR